MKILYLITGLRLGGAEKQLLLLAKLMIQAGNKIVVVAMQPNGGLVADFEQAGITVHQLGVNRAADVPAAYLRLKKVADDFRPDVIHGHMIHANVLASFLKLFNRNYRLICTAHNIREGSKLLMSSYYGIKKVANWATNVSQEAFDYFIIKGYFDKQRSSFLPNAIDTEVFDPAKYDGRAVRRQLGIADDAFVFFSAGRLHYQKNYDGLLRAFAVVSQHIPDVLLYIAGEGPEQSMLQALCKDLNIENNVCFLGRRDDIPSLMSMSDCFVLNSKFEGFGLVIAEAMAMHKPVIGTNCGGVKEVMGGFGRLVNVDDREGLKKAMISARQSNHHDHASARRYVETNYSTQAVQNRWLQLYHDVCYPL